LIGASATSVYVVVGPGATVGQYSLFREAIGTGVPCASFEKEKTKEDCVSLHGGVLVALEYLVFLLIYNNNTISLTNLMD
jgi:hypothetical protein